MINFISDLIAYPIVGLLSMLDHFVSFGNSDVSNETIDRMDELTSGNMVARWRYRINHALGGTRSYEYYDGQENQELISCGCGCGCGCLTLLIVLGIVLLMIII
ncbi:MAG: hypothetical protein IJP46_09700 [Prevotella sp.]|nr:hypothetical protein [Prevotella sp.]